MVSVAMMVGGALSNALAFSGKKILFRERDTWNEQRLARIDFINKKLEEQGHAEKTFKNVDEPLQSYYYLTGD